MQRYTRDLVAMIVARTCLIPRREGTAYAAIVGKVEEAYVKRSNNNKKKANENVRKSQAKKEVPTPNTLTGVTRDSPLYSHKTARWKVSRSAINEKGDTVCSYDEHNEHACLYLYIDLYINASDRVGNTAATKSDTLAVNTGSEGKLVEELR